MRLATGRGILSVAAQRLGDISIEHRLILAVRSPNRAAMVLSGFSA